MDLCLKMAYLLLLTVSEVVNVAVDRASVLLSPRTQEVTVGSPLTLNCSFDVDESTGQVRVNWLFSNATDRQEKKLMSSFALTNQTVQEQTGEEVSQVTRKTWSTLTLSKVTPENNGWYFCQVVVEIPNLWHLDSNESQVIVIGANVGRWPWLWVAVGVGGAVLLALAVIGSISYKITSCRTTENPIYENMSPILKSTVPSQSSPRPGSEVNTYKLTSSMDMGTPTTSQEAGTKQKLTL